MQNDQTAALRGNQFLGIDGETITDRTLPPPGSPYVHLDDDALVAEVEAFAPHAAVEALLARFATYRELVALGASWGDLREDVEAAVTRGALPAVPRL